MPRRHTETCSICFKLFQETGPSPALDARRWGYASLPVFGSLAPQPMKRLYVRGEATSYKAIGYICDKGHVVLNEPGEEAQHLVTPTFPAAVICLATGEKVAVPT